jgi:hypothetical protein
VERSDTHHSAKDFEQWEKGDPKDAAALMKPAREDVLQRLPVSKRVNSSRAADDDGSLIEINGSIATSDEVLAATMHLARKIGQFGDASEFDGGTFGTN